MNRTSFNGYMMMLEKRDTLYEEKIVSMEKAIESIEKEIYAGRIRNVYSLKLGMSVTKTKKTFRQFFIRCGFLIVNM